MADSVVLRPVDGEPAADAVTVEFGPSRTKAQSVRDRRLGPLLFPAVDKVMAPWIRSHGVWEPVEGRWLDCHLRPGMTFLNVGANVGYFCLWAAQTVGPSGSIIAVEPQSDNYALLLANVRFHTVGSFIGINAAAAEAPGSAKLYRSPDNSGDHRLRPPAGTAPSDDAESSVEDVATIRLDDELTDRSVDVIMIDTQGWDHRVLRGLDRTIRRDRPIILMEFTPSWIREMGEDPLAVLAEIADLGYEIGLADAGAVPGAWRPERLVAWCEARDFGTLELWPSGRAFAPLATPSDGYWAVESDGDSLWWWQGDPSGIVSVRGPAETDVDVALWLIPPPGGRAAKVRVNGRRRSLTGPTREVAPVRLDRNGVGAVRIDVDRAHRAPGDFRDLYVAVRNPTVRIKGATR